MPKSTSSSEKQVRHARVVSPHKAMLQNSTTRPSAAADCLARILEGETLDIHFQPIVSLKKKTILGLEALARPVDSISGHAVSPIDLFSAAIRAGSVVELDRLCRRSALKAFPPLAAKQPSPLLFLNFESSVLDKGVLGSGILVRAVQEAGLAPQDIVIEMNESRVGNLDALKNFVDLHRRQGFLIALDDLGVGFSNLSRISLLKPDILKLDRSLVMEIQTDFHKQEVFRSLVGLGRRVGALILAEGVETQEELSTCVDLGTDLIQGFFFARPAAGEGLLLDRVKENLMQASLLQRQRAAHRISLRREESENRIGLWRRVAARLSRTSCAEFEGAFAEWTNPSYGIECLYILDATGMQVTSTFAVNTREANPRRRLFRPAAQGTDHSSKEYFYALIDGGLDRFMTETYLSSASGNLCRTLSGFFEDTSGDKFILCLDVGAE